MAGAVAAAAALLLAPPAAADLRAQQPIEEVAADLAYGLCPLFLAGQLPLTSSELSSRGFSSTVQTSPHPRFGEMSIVEAKRPDGQLAFGGVSGKACTVVVQSANRGAVLAKLRSSMALTGLAFVKSANVSADAPGATVETYSAPVDKQRLVLQLIQAGGPTPVLAAQLFVMDK
jgi:hypothetical protein